MRRPARAAARCSPRPIPGEEKVVTFKALMPGLVRLPLRHAEVPHHITNGMYGLILVEPEGGLPTGGPRILRHAGRALHGAAASARRAIRRWTTTS